LGKKKYSINKDINSGDILDLSNIWSKRPGIGIPSHKMDDFLGKKAKVFIPKNSLLEYKHIE